MADSPHESSLLRFTDLVAFFHIRFDFVISHQRGPVFRLEGLLSFSFKEFLHKTPVVPDFIFTEHTFNYGVSVFRKMCEHRLQVVTRYSMSSHNLPPMIRIPAPVYQFQPFIE